MHPACSAKKPMAAIHTLCLTVTKTRHSAHRLLGGDMDEPMPKFLAWTACFIAYPYSTALCLVPLAYVVVTFVVRYT